MSNKKISLLDKIIVNCFPVIPDKPEVREYLNEVAERKLDEQKTRGLIKVSNAIGKVR